MDLWYLLLEMVSRNHALSQEMIIVPCHFIVLFFLPLAFFINKFEDNLLDKYVLCLYTNTSSSNL